LQGFPANVPANIQLAIQGAETFNPAGLAQMFIGGQMGTVQTVTAAVQGTASALMTGAPAFQTGVQTAFGDLLAGNPVGAYSALQQGLQSLFLPGFGPIAVVPGQLALVPVTPVGPLGALAPVGALPGQMAQSLTNLMPPGSILAQMSQNATHTLSALTDLNTTVNPLLGIGTVGALAPVNFGVGLQLVIDAIGGPGNGLAALNSSAVAFTGAVQAGNASGAIAAVLTAPADMANGFLNGSTLITLPDVHVVSLDNQMITAGTQVAVGGLLTPLSPPTQSANPLGVNTFGQVPGASETGGLIPGLQSIASQLAADITPA